MNRAKADISRACDALGENEHRQRTYNETLKCVRAAVVAVETHKVLHNLGVCTVIPRLTSDPANEFFG